MKNESFRGEVSRQGRQSRIGRALSGLTEVFATDKYFAPVQEDLNRAPGAPTLAQKLGSDVIVIRYGVKRLSRDEISLAAQAIRNARDKSSRHIT